MHFVDTAKTIITMCIEDQKMLGLETNFKRMRPRPHQLETKTTRSSSRPRPHEIGPETGLETYIPAPKLTIMYTLGTKLADAELPLYKLTH